MTAEVDLPESLLGVVVDEARGVLQERDAAALTAALRPLARVDRRAAGSSTLRRQFTAALARDEGFRTEVAAAVAARPDVRALLAGWDRRMAGAAAARAADAGELSLLAAALWAVAPDGWEFGLGACAAAEHERHNTEPLRAERDALSAQVELLERKAADRVRADAERTAEIERLTAKLASERTARRQSEQQAASEAEDLRRAVDDAVAAHEQTRAQLDTLRRQLEREQARANELEAREIADTSAHASSRATAAPPVPAVSADDLASLADAAGELTRRLRDAASRVETRPAQTGGGAPAAPRPRPAAPVARTKPRLPGGLVADTVDGVRAMLADGSATLVVDGYNVSKHAWPEATPMLQRDRLELGLQQVHQRFRCEVVCCYDGVGDEIGGARRRIPGVHVRFSARDQEADELVVDAVRSLPKRVPAVVASSDAWVRDHAEALGAIVVSAATAAALIAAAGRR